MFDFDDDAPAAEAPDDAAEYTSPFDDAAAAAAPESEPEASEAAEFGDVPKKRARKKGRKASGKPRGRPRRDGGTAPRTHSAPVKGPPAPSSAETPSASQPVPGAPPPIPSAQLIPLVRRVDNRLSQRFGTEKLEDSELAEGAAALAQLMHHYLPVALNTPWGPFAAWVALAYGPRMLDRADVQPPKPAQVQESAPSSATFRTPDNAAAPATAPAPMASDALAPVFTNPLANQPDVPAGVGFPG